MPDREKVIEDLEFCVNGHYKVELSLAKKILAMLKEQDAVVRCKDCIHMKVLPCDIHGHIPIYCTNLSIYSEGLDWFCADGEKK